MMFVSYKLGSIRLKIEKIIAAETIPIVSDSSENISAPLTPSLTQLD